MGQKVHPEVFKLSRTSGWKSKYYEKKTSNFNAQIQKNFEINRFIKQFFYKAGLSVHTCKLNYLTNKINIFISYTKNLNLVDGVSNFTCKKIEKRGSQNNQFLQNKINKKIKLFSNELLTQKIKKFLHFIFFKDVAYSINFFFKADFMNGAGQPKNELKKIKPTTIKAFHSFLNKAKLLTSDFFLLKQTISFYLKIFKSSLKKNLKIIVRILKLASLKKKRKVPSYIFLSTFFKIFVLFFNKKLKFAVIFKFLNKNLKRSKPKIEKRSLRKLVFTSLRKYNKRKFFKEGLNLMFLAGSQKESASTLSYFIATSLNNFKNHKLFLAYIKKGLCALALKRKAVIKKLTIQLKGRINGNDRARNYVIRMKKRASLIQIGSRINYSENTTFTPDGTLSVKVWLEYQKVKLCKLRHKKLNTKKLKKVN